MSTSLIFIYSVSHSHRWPRSHCSALTVFNDCNQNLESFLGQSSKMVLMSPFPPWHTSLFKCCDSHCHFADPFWSICLKNWRCALVPQGYRLRMRPHLNPSQTRTVEENTTSVKALMVFANQSQRQRFGMIVWLEPVSLTRGAEYILPWTCSRHTMSTIMCRPVFYLTSSFPI